MVFCNWTIKRRGQRQECVEDTSVMLSLLKCGEAEDHRTSRLLRPLPPLPSLYRSPQRLSGACPGGCCGYGNAGRWRAPARVAWIGGCCPSSCPPLCLGPAPSRHRLLSQAPRCSLRPRRRLLRLRPPSPGPWASLFSPRHVFCPPPPAPCAFARAPSAVPRGLKPSGSPEFTHRFESVSHTAWNNTRQKPC